MPRASRTVGTRVDAVPVLRPQLASGLDPLGPRHDARVGGAAPVGLALPAAERRVARVGPAPRVMVAGLHAAQLVDHLEVGFERLLHVVEEEHLVERADRAALGAGAVVRDDHDERVVQPADLLEELHDATEVVVGEAEEAGVDLHVPGVEPLGIVRQGVPLRHVRVPRRQFGPRRDDAHVELALMDDLAVLFPAAVELALVLVRPLLGHVVRRVTGAGGVVQEEGLVGRVDVRVLDELDRLVGQIDAQMVAVLRQCRLLDLVVVVGQFRIPLVGLATQEAVVALEAATERPAVVGAGGGRVLGRRQVPLADAEGVVAVLQQHLADHRPVEGQDAVVARVAGGGLGDRRQAERVVVAPGQDAAPRRRAERRGVHVGVAQAVGGQAVDDGRLDQPAEAGELPVADVVQHEEEHVGRALRRARRLRPGRRGLRGGAPDDPGERGSISVGLDGHENLLFLPRARHVDVSSGSLCETQS